MQGESDVIEFNQIGTKHSENLKNLFSLIKKDLLSPSLSFVLGRIYNYQIAANSNLSSQENLNSIRDQQVSFSENNNNVYLVTTDGFTLLDIWHYNGSSLLALGSCFEKAYRTKNKVLCYDGLYQINNPQTAIGLRAFFSLDDLKPKFGFKYQDNIQLCLDSLSPKELQENFINLESCTEINAAQSACENNSLWSSLPKKDLWKQVQSSYYCISFETGTYNKASAYKTYIRNKASGDRSSPAGFFLY